MTLAHELERVVTGEHPDPHVLGAHQVDGCVRTAGSGVGAGATGAGRALEVPQSPGLAARRRTPAHRDAPALRDAMLCAALGEAHLHQGRATVDALALTRGRQRAGPRARSASSAISTPGTSAHTRRARSGASGVWESLFWLRLQVRM